MALAPIRSLFASVPAGSINADDFPDPFGSLEPFRVARPIVAAAGNSVCDPRRTGAGEPDTVTPGGP